MSEWGIAAIAFILGLVGGVLRVVISGSFVRPHRQPAESGRPGIEFGSVGVIVAGGAAGFVLWALVVYPQSTTYGFSVWAGAATILAGIGGGDALLHYINKQYGVNVNQQTDQEADQQTEEMAKPLARAQENLVQQLSECTKREQELQRQIDRLERDDTPDN